jgi:hypothetical protein
MATVLEGCTTEDKCSIVRFFLWAKGHNAKDINKEVFPVYSGKYLSRNAVHSWVEKLPSWRQTFHWLRRS